MRGGVIGLPPRTAIEPLLADMGGPTCMRKSQRVKLKLLGRRSGPILCPRVRLIAKCADEWTPTDHHHVRNRRAFILVWKRNVFFHR